jgi:hypothetical protein
MHLYPAERLAAATILALFALNAALIASGGQNVDWGGYARVVSVGLLAMAVGQFYRCSGRSERIGLAATASGLFILFTIAGSMFNYLLLPVGEERIDGFLMMLDGYLGYSWPAFITTIASIPAAGEILRLVYLSSLPQLIVVILVLGFSGRTAELHRFLLTGIVGALLAIGIWSAIPSSGPSAFHEIADATVKALRLVVDPAYGAELNRLATEGPALISPADTLGLIAFPSFHTVMACMAVWFTYRVRPAFPFFLAVNVLMLPAILVHGGHHLMDLFGGLLVFAAAAAFANRIVAVTDTQPAAIAPAGQP